MTSRFGSLFGRTNRNFGEGKSIPPHPTAQFTPLTFNSFAGGFNVADVDEDVQKESSPDCLDMEVSKKDTLVKAPGTVEYELLSALRHPKQLGLFVGSSLQQELILFDAQYIGIKREDGTPVVWVPTSTPASEVKPFFWTAFADQFIFANGNNIVQSKAAGEDTVQDEPTIPNGETFAVVAARLFVGGAVIDGIKRPMAVAWSGTDGYQAFNFVTDLGSGFEELISDQSQGDAIIAIRAMGLDMAAILCRNSVWVGRRTGDLDRPLDYQPRVTGSGCIAETTAKSVTGGVIYLSTQGIEFFDGNSVQHISAAIDADLLPLDFANLTRYSASYNPTSQRYHLYTPLATYVFDILKGRWYKRSLIVLGGESFAEPDSPPTWADMVGSWAVQHDSWLTLGGSVTNLPEMVLLGVNSDGRYALHKELYTSYAHFGFTFKPRWQSVLSQNDRANYVVSTDTISIRYKQGGTVDLYLPDLNAFLTKVTQVPLTLTVNVSPRLEVRRSMFTGLEGGFKIEFLSGVPEVSEIQLNVLPRGPRITPGVAFIPRDYQPDF